MNEIELAADATPTTIVPPTYTGAGALRLTQWAEEAHAANILARNLVRTPFAGSWRGDENGATAAILKGAEIGLTPVTALAAFDNIQGTPAPKAITLRALVQSHGHDLEIVEETEQRATARYRRNGRGDWQQTSFTIEEAAQMNLTGKDNWRKQPRNMLVARVTAKAARLVASDVILGIGYSSEEVRDHMAPDRRHPEPSPAPGVPAPVEPPASPAAPSVDEDAQASAGEPLLNTRGKLAKAMFAALGQAGISDKDDRLAYIEATIGRAVSSSAEMTIADARTVLDALARLERGDQ